MTLDDVEVTSGTKITLLEQLSPSDDVLGGEKCAVKRWRVEVKDLSGAEVEAKKKAADLAAKVKAEEEATAKKMKAEEAAKIAASAALHQPPPPPPKA